MWVTSILNRYSRLRLFYATQACINMVDINTFVFLDTETTGLPSQESYKTRITELSMVAVEADHIRLGVFPRVQNKLTFCFNPWKLISKTAEDITELSNKLLEHQSKFSDNTVDSINSFLSHNPQPVCFVAHNGDKFDFPLLQKEILNTKKCLDKDIYCIDSLDMFRRIHERNRRREDGLTSDTTEPVIQQDTEVAKDNVVEVEGSNTLDFNDNFDELLLKAVEGLDNDTTDGVQAYQNQRSPSSGESISQKVLESQRRNETTPVKKFAASGTGSSKRSPKKLKLCKRDLTDDRVSFKLGDVYKRLVKKEMVGGHQAETDALSLVMIAATMGDEFVDWANAHANKFCDIKPLQPWWEMAYKK